MHRHAGLADFEAALAAARVYPFTAHAGISYTQVRYEPGDCLLFGSESHGLPVELLRRHAEATLHIPMPAGKVRSLNLATAVGIALYEALRQLRNW